MTNVDSEPLFLFDNCRNTKYIHDSAYQYYKGTEVEAPDIEGEPVQLVEKSSLELQVKEIDNNISRLLNNTPAKAGGFELRTESPDTRRLNDAY